MKYILLLLLCTLSSALCAQIGKVQYGSHGFNLELYPEPDKNDCCNPQYIRWALLQNSNTNIFTDQDKEYLYDLKNEILDDIESCSCESDYLDQILDSLITDIVILSNFDPYDFDYNDDTISLKRLNVIKIPTTIDFEISQLKVGDYVITEGFYDPFDGGGAKYIIKDSVEINNINTFKTELGVAELLPAEGNRVNLQQLGVSPVIDDNTPRIQKAIELYDHIYSFANVSYPVVDPIILRSNLRLEFSPFTEFRQRGPKGNLMLSTPGFATSDSTIRNVYISGGIFNYDTNNRTISAVKNGALGDYAILLNNIQNIHISNLRVKFAPKYAISLGDFQDVFFDNIYLETNSDGIHAEGPGENLNISNVYGYTGDDFIAISCANWTPNAYSRGDINNVFIKDLFSSGHPEGEGSGNIVALWAGNSGLGEESATSYTLSNVTINNVNGISDTGSSINLANYGTQYDASSGPSFGGVVKNISINNVFARQGIGRAQIGLNSNYGENITISNVYAANELSSIEVRGHFTNVTIDNVYYRDMITPSLFLGSTGKIEYLSILNSYFSQRDNQAFFKITPTEPTMDLTLQNTILEAKPNKSQMFLEVDDLDLHLINSKIKNSYTGIKINGSGEHNIYLDNMVFENTHFGVGSSAESTINLFIDSYLHLGGQDYNTFHSTNEQVVTNIISTNELKGKVIETGSNKIINYKYPIGTEFMFKNISTSPISISVQNGLLDSESSFMLESTNLVTIVKINSTDWEILDITDSSPKLHSTPTSAIALNANGFTVEKNIVVTNDSNILYELPTEWENSTLEIVFMNKSSIIKRLVGSVDLSSVNEIEVAPNQTITFIWDSENMTWWEK